MTTLQNISEQVKSYGNQAIGSVRRRILGANNERLDLLVDTFFKLAPQQRNLTLAGGGFLIALFFFGGLALYFSQIKSLGVDLNKRFDALDELRSFKLDYQTEQRRFDKLSEVIESKVSKLRIKPFFEQVGISQGVVVVIINELKSPLPAENPLSQKFQEVKVDLRLNKISLPKLMSFLIEIEKSGNYLRVKDLQIKALFGDKLYFDAQVKVGGVVLSN